VSVGLSSDRAMQLANWQLPDPRRARRRLKGRIIHQPERILGARRLSRPAGSCLRCRLRNRLPIGRARDYRRRSIVG
jgi:hypothetical protein